MMEKNLSYLFLLLVVAVYSAAAATTGGPCLALPTCGYCPNGYRKDWRGCKSCDCYTTTVATPCPTLPTCNYCPSGYRYDRLGCKTCDCYTTTKGTPCPALPTCGYCPNGYRKDWRGCKSCDCYTTTVATPCPTLPTCGYCPSGYRYDWRGCKTCDCYTTTVATPCPALPTCGYCPSGYRYDWRGCKTCDCYTTTKSTPCPTLPTCGYCPNGYRKDWRGCKSCDCYTTTVATPCPALPTCGYCSSGYRYDWRGCKTCECYTTTAAYPCPAVACDNHCPYGHRYDSNGCVTCECNTAEASTTTQGTNCPALPTCAYCPDGYRYDYRGCKTCDCVTSADTTTARVAVQTTRQFWYERVEVVNGRANLFQSPNYYRPYYRNSNVTYIINLTNPERQQLRVIFRFPAFNVEACGSVCCDKLTLGGKEYCGKLDRKEVVLLSDGVIKAEFTSDGNNELTGFDIRYDASPVLNLSPSEIVECGEVSSQTSGYIVSPNYPGTVANRKCSHTLNFNQNRPYTVRFRFIDFGLGRDCGGFVSIPRVSRNSKYCGGAFQKPNFGKYFERTVYNGIFQINGTFATEPVGGYVIQYQAWPGFPADRPTTPAPTTTTTTTTTTTPPTTTGVWPWWTTTVYPWRNPETTTDPWWGVSTTRGWTDNWTSPGPRRSLLDMLRELAWRARLIRDNLNSFANAIDETANRAASGNVNLPDAPAEGNSLLE